MKTYLKVFLITGILFGLAMGGFIAIIEDINSGLESGLKAGLLFGIAMSLLAGSIHNYKIRDHGPESNQGVNQTRTICLEIPDEIAFDKACEIIKQIGAKCKARNKNEGLIDAVTSASNASYGEHIRVKVDGKSANKTTLTVSSSPIRKFTLLDFGKNYENVENIIGLLSHSEPRN